MKLYYGHLFCHVLHQNYILKKGSDTKINNLEEIKYEGFGPGGTSLIVETMTDNRNRTISEIRQIFSKNGGSIAENGSVSHNFKRKGELIYKSNKGHISVIEMDEKGNYGTPVKVIDRPYHLSYPFIFKHKENYLNADYLVQYINDIIFKLK